MAAYKGRIGRNGAAAELPSVVIAWAPTGEQTPGQSERSFRGQRVARRGAEYIGTMEVQEKHRFDERSLERFMSAEVEGFVPPVRAEQFKGGQSNPTYRLTDGAGRRYVLRRKPPGKLLPSAHAVDREFRVISALNKTDVPTPRAYALCEDDSVVGTAFYIMEYCDGRVLWDPLLPEVPEGGPPGDPPRQVRDPGAAARRRLRSPRPGRFRPARQLRGAPDLALGQAVQGVGDREDRVDGPAARLAARPPAGQRRDGAGARRLPPRQHDLPSERAQGAGHHRLGDLHPRRSAGRTLLPLHAVAHAEGLGRPRGP